jgi:Uma2 family endonuclease
VVVSDFPIRHLVTVDEFERMVGAGVFPPDRRLELVEGEIVDMSPMGGAHQACIDRVTASFAPFADSGQALVRIPGSFRAGDMSQPQPDVALVRPRDDAYAGGHPRSEDLLLVVEVADSNLGFDMWTKLPAYGRAGVAETWVVDLDGGVVDVASEPSRAGYGRMEQAVPGDTMAPGAFPDIQIEVRELLG